MQKSQDKESRTRSVLKAISWRLVATTTIVILAYLKTGSIAFALELGALEMVIKFVLYYAHERVWQIVPRGTIRKGLSNEGL